MDEFDDLDTSWIEKEEKINSTEESLCIREQLNEIKLFFVYINSDNAIEQITKDREPLVHGISNGNGSGCGSGITKERLLQIIQTKRNLSITSSPIKKYKLMDILSFQVDIESEDFDSFLASDSDEISEHFLKVLPIFDGIECPESMFIFHDINSLYFLFKENENVGGGGGGIRSILKSNTSSSEKRATKKVRILMEGEPVLENKRKSSKRNLKLGKYTRKVLQ
jgi:hypothetical protein